MSTFILVLIGIVLSLDTIGSILMVASLALGVKKQMREASEAKKAE